MVSRRGAKRHALRAPCVKNSFPLARGSREHGERGERGEAAYQPICFAASSFMMSSAPPPVIITFTSR